MRSVLTAVVGALALMATGPAAVGHSPAAGTPRFATRGGSAHTPRAATPRSAARDVVDEVLDTDDGTFSATYFAGPPPGHRGPTAVVAVAQRPGPGGAAFPSSQSQWSYEVTSSTGSLLAWTQAGRRATWCQRLRRGAPVECGGPVTVERSNGFLELQAGFVPGVAVDVLRGVVASGRPALTVTNATTMFGPGAECVSTPSGPGRATWCALGRRLLYSSGTFTGPFVNGPVTLTSWSPDAPSSDFSARRGCPGRCRHAAGLPGV